MIHKSFKKVDNKLAAMSISELIAEREKALQAKPKPRKVYADFITKELNKRG